MLTQLNEDVLAACLGPDAMLGQSYLFSMVTMLQQGRGVEAVSRIWRFNVVPQLIDVLRSYGAEALLDLSTRGTWFVEHGSELVSDVDTANAALVVLDTHLAGLGMQVRVDGTGLSRGARVVDATNSRPDMSDRPVDLDRPGLEAELAASEA